MLWIWYWGQTFMMKKNIDDEFVSLGPLESFLTSLSHNYLQYSTNFSSVKQTNSWFNLKTRFALDLFCLKCFAFKLVTSISIYRHLKTLFMLKIFSWFINLKIFPLKIVEIPPKKVDPGLDQL